MILPVPTVRTLVVALGEHLSPVAGVTPPDDDISAVHISELLDPTSYLSGGELLLTTGLSLAGADIDVDEYAERLRAAGVVAVGLGLGPVFEDVPEMLAIACRRSGVPLLVVPKPTPFIAISRAYWTAVARSGEQALIDQLVAQRALVDAAGSPDPVATMLRSVARWIGGWAATMSAHGEVQQVQPTEFAPAAAALRTDIRRLRGVGAATLAAEDRRVALFPLGVSADSAEGYLAVGTDGAMDAATRRTVLTAAALLTLVAARGAASTAGGDTVRGDVAILLELGHLDAARALTAERGLPGLGVRLRTLAVRSTAVGDVLAAVTDWCPAAYGRQLDGARVWFAVPTDHRSLDELRERLDAVDPSSTAAISHVVQAEATVSSLPDTLDALSSIPDAAMVALVPPSESGIDLALRRLRERGRPTQVAAVAAYLRHRGRWEAAARELGVHRNTLRHRIGRAQELLHVDLDDPDVAARMWLELRADADSRGGLRSLPSDLD